MKKIKIQHRDLKTHIKQILYFNKNDSIETKFQEIDKAIDEYDIYKQKVLDQIFWERDVAIDQLHLLGYSFGEKPRNCNWKWIKEKKGWFVNTSCKDIIKFDSKKDYIYCPYCGNKINEL